MKTRWALLTVIIAGAIMILGFGCSLFGDNEGNEGGGNSSAAMYSREYWGEWVRMDTGENWYISNTSIMVNTSEKNAVSLKKQSSRVIEVTEEGKTYYLYASRVNNGKFFGNIANIVPGERRSMVRTLSIGGIEVVIGNPKNPGDRSTRKSDNNGRIEFEGTPGDEYQITVGDQDTIVRPKADGEDIGTITLTSGLNFKTKIASNSDMQALYAGGLEYDFEIEIENTGALDCTAARFDLALDDGLTLISGETTGILRTIEPGKTRLIPVRLKCGAINDEYEFKRIAIRIEDSLNGNVWNDSVSVKFNIGVVNFAIQSETPVNGVVITPHGKAYSFKCDYAYRGYSWYAADTDEKCKTTVSVPWSASDFLVVFSGATADTETVYNMGVNIPNLDDNFTGFLDVMNYEPNNAEAQATQISDSTPIMSYLHKNDIDYYSVNVRATQPALRTLAVRDCLVVVDRSYGTYPAPDDKRIVSGGQYRMELEVAGLLPELETTYTFVLSTGSEYAEITKAAGSIANLTGAGSWSRGNLSTGGRYGYWTKVLDGNNDFRFSLPEHCPPGVKLPFVITIADQLGNEWKELVQVPVEP